MYSHPQQRAEHDVQQLRRDAGKWLRQLRENRSLSQRELARLVGVEYYTFIAQIEVGRGRIPPDRYTRWADALNITPYDFVKDLMRFYDPVTHRILFDEELPAPPTTAPHGTGSSAVPLNGGHGPLPADR